MATIILGVISRIELLVFFILLFSILGIRSKKQSENNIRLVNYLLRTYVDTKCPGWRFKADYWSRITASKVPETHKVESFNTHLIATTDSQPDSEARNNTLEKQLPIVEISIYCDFTFSKTDFSIFGVESGRSEILETLFTDELSKELPNWVILAGKRIKILCTSIVIALISIMPFVLYIFEILDFRLSICLSIGIFLLGIILSISIISPYYIFKDFDEEIMSVFSSLKYKFYYNHGILLVSNSGMFYLNYIRPLKDDRIITNENRDIILKNNNNQINHLKFPDIYDVERLFEMIFDDKI